MSYKRFFEPMHGTYRIECSFCLQRPLDSILTVEDFLPKESSLLGFTSGDARHYVCVPCIKYMKTQLDKNNEKNR